MKTEERSWKSVYNLTESFFKNPCVYIIYLQIMVPNDCWSLTTGAHSNQPRSNLWVFTILPSGSPSKDMVQSTQSDSLGISAWENIPT